MKSLLLKIGLLVSVFSSVLLGYAYTRGVPEQIPDDPSLPNFGTCPGGRCSVLVEEMGYYCKSCDYSCNYCDCIPQVFHSYEYVGNCVVVEKTVPNLEGGQTTYTFYECWDMRPDPDSEEDVIKNYCFLIAGS